MSSKGAHIKGTDGSDYNYRQKVASHYQISANYKFYLKFGSEVLKKQFDITYPFFEKLDLPAAYHWEYVWCFSFIPPLFGILSFKKNNLQLMRYHYYGQFVLGVLPCAVGLGEQLPELIGFLRDMENFETPTFKGTFPMVILWFIFFILAFQLNLFSMYCGSILINCWSGRYNKKAKKDE
ncbi:Protein jagunal homolog 1 [Strongyloides ratti]|uniref:Protein jagunal homolog 1 n=1 Tax=Strongyloides ratti TaxID=34506 RepID=A0A090L937_STRRB|nr:Protein jagunal homolog 1 [Strongyloides ratti]CEF64658.1 Protein jagunal homolog 1 [Strongyloides ratti]